MQHRIIPHPTLPDLPSPIQHIVYDVPHLRTHHLHSTSITPTVSHATLNTISHSTHAHTHTHMHTPYPYHPNHSHCTTEHSTHYTTLHYTPHIYHPQQTTLPNHTVHHATSNTPPHTYHYNVPHTSSIHPTPNIQT